MESSKQLHTPSTPSIARSVLSVLSASTVLLGALSTASIGCQSAETESEASLPQLAPKNDPGGYGIQIAQHPRFPVLLNRVNAKIKGIVLGIAGQPLQQTIADIAAFESCKLAEDLGPCAPKLNAFGISPASVSADRADVELIANAVGLSQVSPGTVEAAFHHAVFIRNHAAEASVLVPYVAGTTFMDAPGWVCDAACKETMGNVLGTAEGTYLYGLHASTVKKLQRTAALTPDDNNDTATILAVIGLAVTVGTAIEKWIWNSGESDKECDADSDCADNEFCHRLGSNDCRPANGQGHLCTRGAECLSNCCKIFWGIPQCRPADRCD